MNFSQRQADPRRHLMGISLVVAFHLIVVYALVTGLAKKVVDVVRAPIETKVIEEIKKPPPLPEVVLPPPPKLDAPPPPYIPPPEVQIAAPPPPQPAITASTPTPPAAPFNLTPPTPAVTPAAPRAAVLAMGVACASQVQPVMPAKATREGINGSVRARATIRGGKFIAVDILSSSPRGVFDAAVRTAMLQYGCQAGDEEIKAEQTFEFKIAE
jgi:periplasmic protein TonB